MNDGDPFSVSLRAALLQICCLEGQLEQRALHELLKQPAPGHDWPVGALPGCWSPGIGVSQLS